MEPTPYLKNRRTGVILPYNPHLATHPDMVACEELPYPKEVKKPTTPTHRRYLAAEAAKKEAAKEAAKKEAAKEVAKEATAGVEKKTKPSPKKATKAKSESEPETPGDAEINDLLAGIEHG